MSLSSFIKKYRNVGLGLLALGGFGAFQLFWPTPAVTEREKTKDQQVIQASIDTTRTLHGQVDDLKEQLKQVAETLKLEVKQSQDLKRQFMEQGDAYALAQKQAQHAAAEDRKRWQRELDAKDRAAAEAERRRREAETRTKSPQTTPTGQAPPAVPTLLSFYELRTIGTSTRGPTAPPPLAHHTDTAYLPAGCFAKIRLVTGVSATSQLGGSGGASWGHPILYTILEPFECARKLEEIGMVAVRQRTRLPLDGCLGFATGKADLASSRVQAEATLLSCIDPDATAFERPMKGYLVGIDGTQGIVGEVQTHESAKIGKAFLAGMIEEAAAFFAASRKGVTIQVTGQTVPHGGMETTLRKVADYWLEQARALQPTLFVPSTTEAYLVILEGMPLDGLQRVNWLKTGVM